MIDVAVGNRDARIGEPTDPRRYPRHDAKRHVILDQRQRLLAPTPEDEGIAALQPEDAIARLRELDETKRDVALLGGRLAAALSRIFENGARPRKLQALGIDQRVVHDDIGFHQPLDCEHRQKARVAGPRADEPDTAAIHRREVRKYRFDHDDDLCPAADDVNAANAAKMQVTITPNEAHQADSKYEDIGASG